MIFFVVISLWSLSWFIFFVLLSLCSLLCFIFLSHYSLLCFIFFILLSCCSLLCFILLFLHGPFYFILLLKLLHTSNEPIQCLFQLVMQVDIFIIFVGCRSWIWLSKVVMIIYTVRRRCFDVFSIDWEETLQWFGRLTMVKHKSRRQKKFKREAID